MTEYIYKADNVEKAIEEGLKDLNLKESEAKIQVIEAGSGGILGFFKKESLVKIIPLDENYEKKEKINEEKNLEKEEQKENLENKKEQEINKTKQKENIIKEEKQEENKKDYILENQEKIVNYTEKIIHSMGFDKAKIEFEEEGNRNYTLRIVNVENSSLLIGKRGNTLNSLQVLVENYAKKFTKYYFRINVDCDEYRENRKETLEELAINMAKKSKKVGKPVELEPMTSSERKIIHNALKDIKNVETESVGEEPYRYLVIKAK